MIEAFLMVAVLGQELPRRASMNAILVNLSGVEIALTSVEQGVPFDIDGNGVPERVAWTTADSRVAFLAIDHDGNGRIDDGKELFGVQSVSGATYGFHALDMLNQQMGGGEVASIDIDQPIFLKLLLWQDLNHNGVSEPNELQPAGDVVSGIGLGLVPMRRVDAHGNNYWLRGFAHVRTAPGKNMPQSPEEDRERVIDLYDTILRVQRN